MRLHQGLFLIPILTTLATGGTFVVDKNGGGDFLEIQEAIDALDPGDIILIRQGNYQGFDLAKGLTLRADHGYVNARSITVRDIPQTQRAAISGISTAGTDSWLIEDCSGEIILEDISHSRGDMTIQDCSNVSMNNLEIFQRSYKTGLTIRRSKVTLSNAEITFEDVPYFSCGFRPGGNGITVVDSYLVLANSTVSGGNGEHSTPDDFGCQCGDAAPENGGHGLLARRSEVVILGTEAHYLSGGEGGDYFQIFPCGCIFDGGTGGDGIRFSDSTILISRVHVNAGPGGGVGTCSGTDGLPMRGDSESTLTRLDELPSIQVTSDLHPGDQVQVDLDSSNAPGLAFLAFADRNGFFQISGFEGPLFSAIKGNWFFAAPLGPTGPSGMISFSFHLDQDPSLVGFGMNIQSAILADHGNLYLSNSLMRIIGD